MAGIWSGYLTFGLVTIPVRLQAGARGERVRFHLLHASDRVRLKQQMVCPRDGEVVGRDQTVRGYEYAKGEYVAIPEEAIKAAAPPSGRQLAIVEFCRAEAIDPIWFASSYYLVPEAAGQRAYGLLLRAMRESGTCAVAQLSLHNREYLCLVRASRLAGVPLADGQAAEARDGLLLHTLYYLDELRVAEGFNAAGAAGTADAAAAELKLARQLIAGLARAFDPTRFEDRYRKNLEAAVEAAIAGRPAPRPAAVLRLAPVTDLMAALKASLARPPAAAGPGQRASGRAAARPKAPRPHAA